MNKKTTIPGTKIESVLDDTIPEGEAQLIDKKDSSKMDSVPFRYADERGVIIDCNVNEESTFDVQFESGKRKKLSYEQFLAVKNAKTTKKTDRILQIHGVKE